MQDASEDNDRAEKQCQFLYPCLLWRNFWRPNTRTPPYKQPVSYQNTSGWADRQTWTM